MSAGIMSLLSEIVALPRTARISQQLQALFFDEKRSEIEFLHGAESCPSVLSHLDKSGIPLNRRMSLLDLWKRIGRPHPAILRGALLNLHSLIDLSSFNRDDITDLVNWSHAAFSKVREFALSKSPSDNASVAEPEKDANQQALEQVEKRPIPSAIRAKTSSNPRT
jgi:hypothetical protein